MSDGQSANARETAELAVMLLGIPEYRSDRERTLRLLASSAGRLDLAGAAGALMAWAQQTADMNVMDASHACMAAIGLHDGTDPSELPVRWPER